MSTVCVLLISHVQETSWCVIQAFWEFPGGPVAKTPHFCCQGLGSIPGEGNRILQAVLCGQRKKTEFWWDEHLLKIWWIVSWGEFLEFSSVQFSCLVISDSLRPYELQHTRPPCSSPTPRVYPDSCPLSQWCHLTISSSVILFSSCPQSFPASGSFQMSQLFISGGQSIEVSASTSVLPMNTQDWFPLG